MGSSGQDSTLVNQILSRREWILHAERLGQLLSGTKTPRQSHGGLRLVATLSHKQAEHPVCVGRRLKDAGRAA